MNTKDYRDTEGWKRYMLSEHVLLEVQGYVSKISGFNRADEYNKRINQDEHKVINGI